MTLSIPQILAWAVAGVAVLMWIVVWSQIGELREQPDNMVIRAIVVTLAWIAGLLTVFGFVFWSNDQVTPLLTGPQTQVITRGYMLTSVFVALYFRRLYRNGQ